MNANDENIKIKWLQILSLISLSGFTLFFLSFWSTAFIYHKNEINGHILGASDFDDFYYLLLQSNPHVMADAGVIRGGDFSTPWASGSAYSSIAHAMAYLFSNIFVNFQTLSALGFIASICGIFFICYPLWKVTFNVPLYLRITFLMSVGVLSYPSLMSLSRANIAMYMVTPVFLIFYYLQLSPKKYTRRIVQAFILTAGLKFSYLVLTFILLLQKKFKLFFIVLLSIILISFVCYFIWPDSLINKISENVSNLLGFAGNKSDAYSLLYYNTSIAALIAVVVAEIFGVNSTVFEFLVHNSYMPGAVFLFFTIYLLLFRAMPYWLISFLIISLIAMVPARTYGYTQTGLIASIAIFIFTNFEGIENAQTKNLSNIRKLLLCSGLFLIWIPDFFWLNFADSTSPAGTIFTYSKSITLAFGIILISIIGMTFPKKQFSIIGLKLPKKQ